MSTESGLEKKSRVEAVYAIALSHELKSGRVVSEGEIVILRKYGALEIARIKVPRVEGRSVIVEFYDHKTREEMGGIPEEEIRFNDEYDEPRVSAA